jgi:type I restriction enzyme M protein
LAKGKKKKNNQTKKANNCHAQTKLSNLDGKTSSEVDAYVYIKNQLKLLGWNIKNPDRDLQGQVYTQGECLSHPEIKLFLDRDKPENIVKLTDTLYWIIEAKRTRKEIDKAISEAQEYATRINESKNIKAVIATGIAGNDSDTYTIQSRYLVGSDFKPITLNGKDITSLLSVEMAKEILTNNSPDLKDIPINEDLFYKKAVEINRILHLGAINKGTRARVMAALLLCFVEDTLPNLDAPPSVLIPEINARVKRVLKREGKDEFYHAIELSPPTDEINHFKFKNALVRTFQELQNLNIRSAMNSGTDVLGQFYEIFLKYGNGAKEIGIVLTPRHITKFVAEVMNLSLNDVIYDGAAGTGGFLVAAFDNVRKTTNSQKDINDFKTTKIFGIEQDSEVLALAIVNMIFRGDGKNNLKEGDSFRWWLASSTNRNGIQTAEYKDDKPEEYNPVVTKVMMNPPFALKRSAEKEYRFVDHAIEQMKDGGYLFSVLPYSVLVKPNEFLRWRREFLSKNSLLCVITFPEDLFYPIGVRTVGFFAKKGVPHPKDQKVLWIRALNDGLAKSKGKRMFNMKAKDDYKTIKPLVKGFLVDQNLSVNNIQKFQKACPIDFNDELLELVPENYLDENIPTMEELQKEIDQTVREAAAYLIRTRREEELQGEAIHAD